MTSLNRYTIRSASMLGFGVLGMVALCGTAMAATTGSQSGTAGSQSGTSAAAPPAASAVKISKQQQVSNGQAARFKDNGKVLMDSQNMQVDSYGKLGLANSLHAWMGESGVVMDRGRMAGMYVPGHISYVNDTAPNVVLTIELFGASMYRSPKAGTNNPTLILPANTKVTFMVINGSNGYPGTFTVVKKPPPYPPFVVPKNEGVLFNSGWITRAPLSGPASYRTIEYSFSQPGTYYYLSLQPGNAQSGQWGKIIVKSPTNGGSSS